MNSDDLAHILPPPGTHAGGAHLVVLTDEQVAERIRESYARLRARCGERALDELIAEFVHSPWEHPELEEIGINIWLEGGPSAPSDWAEEAELAAWESEILARVS